MSLLSLLLKLIYAHINFLKKKKKKKKMLYFSVLSFADIIATVLF